MRGDQGWPPHLGGPFLSRDRRSRDRRRLARRRFWRDRVYLAHQGSNAGGPLPDRRSDTTLAWHSAVDAADGKNLGPNGRHDDRARVNVFPTQIEELILS